MTPPLMLACEGSLYSFSSEPSASPLPHRCAITERAGQQRAGHVATGDLESGREGLPSTGGHRPHFLSSASHGVSRCLAGPYDLSYFIWSVSPSVL